MWKKSQHIEQEIKVEYEEDLKLTHVKIKTNLKEHSLKMSLNVFLKMGIKNTQVKAYHWNVSNYSNSYQRMALK